MRAPILALVLLLAAVGSAAANHPQTVGSRTTSFDHKTGNEWWVEVIVSGSPARVESRDDGGAWVALEKKSWGAWAKSYHIEPGHRVQFRASWSDGVTIESCWFTHPAGSEQCATTPPPPPPSNGTFAFTHGGGNEWWVEAKVSPKPVAVEAMDTGGAWKALAFKSWGEWAASFHIEPGHEVKFRAKGADGVWHESCWFSHPAGVARCETGPGPTSWPREGSYVRYLLDSGMGVPGYSEYREYWLNYTYTGGAWVGTCEGWEESGPEGEETLTIFNRTAATTPPPLGNPKVVQPGQQVEVTLPDCSGMTTTAFVNGQVTGEDYHDGIPYRVNGQPTAIDMWHATYEDDGCPCESRGLAWHPDTGLMVDYTITYRRSHEAGHLVDTDAPLGESTFPPKPSWPKEGSFVTYRVNETNETGTVLDTYTVNFRYTGGTWGVDCGGYQAGAWLRSPPMAPTSTSAGAMVRPTEVFVCGITPPAVVVQGKYPYWTTKNGAAYRANVWWGDEHPDTWGDEDGRWDTATGLLLEWEDHGGYFNGDEGYVLNTDAPLAAR